MSAVRVHAVSMLGQEFVFAWLKHAFSAQPAGPAVPTAGQLEIIDRICREVVRRDMVLPAEMALQSSAPLNYLSGQMLRFFEPFLGTILDARAIRELATFLEQPGAVDFLCQRLRWFQQTKSQ